MSNREIELRFYGFNESKVRSKIKELGGILVNKKRIMPLMVYYHPLGKEDSYIRVRDEGKQITLTSKTDLKSKYVTEYEIKVDNYEQANLILKSLGCKKNYAFEKVRETWQIPGCKEIVLDSYPGTDSVMEIECNTEKSVINAAKKIGVYPKYLVDKLYLDDIYLEKYGISKDRKLGDLTFKDAHKQVGKYIKKNKKEFLDILKEQQKLIGK